MCQRYSGRVTEIKKADIVDIGLFDDN